MAYCCGQRTCCSTFLPPLTLSQVIPLRNIRVLDHTGRYSHSVNKHTRKSLLKNHRAQELEDGSLQLFPPTIQVRDGKVYYYTGNGWRILPGMGRPAFNLGVSGQGVIHYPVPYAFEGKFGAAYQVPLLRRTART